MLLPAQLVHYKNEQIMEKELKDLIRQIIERQKKLQSYLNYKELSHLQHLRQNIENGLDAVIGVKAFLEVVPEGEFDSDRKGYYELIRSRIDHLENEQEKQ